MEYQHQYNDGEVDDVEELYEDEYESEEEGAVEEVEIDDEVEDAVVEGDGELFYNALGQDASALYLVGAQLSITASH